MAGWGKPAARAFYNVKIMKNKWGKAFYTILFSNNKIIMHVTVSISFNIYYERHSEGCALQPLLYHNTADAIINNVSLIINTLQYVISWRMEYLMKNTSSWHNLKGRKEGHQRHGSILLACLWRNDDRGYNIARLQRLYLLAHNDIVLQMGVSWEKGQAGMAWLGGHAGVPACATLLCM